MQLQMGAQKLAEAQAEIDEARAQLEAGQAQLDAARQQVADGGLAELDAQQEQLTAGAKELEKNQELLSKQAKQLDNGQALAQYAGGASLVSESDSTALGVINFDTAATNVPVSSKTQLQDRINAAEIPGVKVLYSSDVSSKMPALIGVGEVAGVLIAAVVLLVMLGTLIAAGLPLISALVGVGVGVAGSLAFSGIIDMLSVTPVLGLMIGLAVGIDYSLFILNRHRKNLLRGVDVQKSIGLANGTSGNAVVFAGSTVVIALLALNVTGIGFLGLMGTVGAVSVFTAVLVAVTLAPALLSLAGLRVLPSRVRNEVGEKPRSRALPKEMSSTRAWVTLVACLVGLVVVALPATSMRLGLPMGSSEPADSTQFQAYEAIEDGFGPGMNGPLLVVAEYPEAVPKDDLVATQLAIAEKLSTQASVTSVVPVGQSEDGKMLAFQVVPAEGPESEDTSELVHSIRGMSPLDGAVSGWRATHQRRSTFHRSFRTCCRFT